MTVLGTKTSETMEEKQTFSKAERRWIVREIQSGRLTIADARERFYFSSKNPDSLIRTWMQRYSSDVLLTLPIMTEKERQKVESLQKQLRELEKQLEYAQMKNVALETMIDLAEDQLKIVIRKKSGPKQ
jgi:hypothetical protein